MDASEILHNMCSRDLSNVDIKTICKYRDFSEKEASFFPRSFSELFSLGQRSRESACFVA
jgi:hypothetical protein